MAPVCTRLSRYHCRISGLAGLMDRRNLPYRNVVPGQRWCSQCKTFKPANTDNFFRNKRYGLSFVCKPCHGDLNRSYNKLNRDKRDASVKAWQARNPDRYKASMIASKYRADGLTIEIVWQHMHERHQCPYCETLITSKNISYDHIDGPGSPVQPTCVPCNLLKHVFTDEDWRRIVALLGPERMEFYRNRIRAPASRRSA